MKIAYGVVPAEKTTRARLETARHLKIQDCTVLLSSIHVFERQGVVTASEASKC